MCCYEFDARRVHQKVHFYTANIFETEKKVLAVSMLAEGNSIRSIERITGIHRDTIMRLASGLPTSRSPAGANGEKTTNNKGDILS